MIHSINFSRINFKILFLILMLSKFAMFLSSLVHAFIVQGKNEILEKPCFILNLGTVSEFRIIHPRLHGDELC